MRSLFSWRRRGGVRQKANQARRRTQLEVELLEIRCTPTLAGVGSILLDAAQNVTPADTSGISIGPTTLPNWTINQPGYLQTISASGGMGAVTFSETGILPEGLSLSSSGVLSGTPTLTVLSTFTVQASDSLGNNARQDYQVTINPAISIGPGLASWTVNKPGYQQYIQTYGGTYPVTFTETGALPPGLTISSSGVVSGTPTDVGQYNFTVLVTDAAGATASNGLSITVNDTNYVAAEFPGHGVWRHSDFLGWQQLTLANATAVASDNYGNVAAAFSNGLWYYADGTGWENLCPAIPSQLRVNGVSVVAEFPDNGLWRYGYSDSTLYPSSVFYQWQQITPADALSIAANYGANVVVASFPGNGTWLFRYHRYQNYWQQLTPAVATQVSMDPDGQSVTAVFPGNGVYQFTVQSFLWQQLTPAGAFNSATVYGAVVCAFANGVWLHDNQAGWKLLTTAMASQVAITDIDNVFAAFSGNGLWEYNQNGWQQLTPAEASALG